MVVVNHPSLFRIVYFRIARCLPTYFLNRKTARFLFGNTREPGFWEGKFCENQTKFTKSLNFRGGVEVTIRQEINITKIV